MSASSQRRLEKLSAIFVCLFASLLLAGCGGGPSSGTPSSSSGSSAGSASNAAPTYSIGGTISGLSGTVVLQLNGGNELSVSTDGSFQFSGALASGASYQVSVLTQPTNQICTVSNGSGTVSKTVNNIEVACNAQYTIGGTVSGLTGSVVLQDNSGDDQTITSDGAFTFTTKLASGSGYSVSVLTQPTGQTCNVQNGSGTAIANVTNVAVSCTAIAAYTVGGTIINLTASGLAIENNNTASQTVNPGATQFVFATLLPTGANYDVSVQSQPSGQLCDTENASGSIGSSNVTNVVIVCGLWSWDSGSQSQGAPSVFGTQGVAAAENVPGERLSAMSWTDASGDLWLFGGADSDVDPGPVLNDLWMYSPASGFWTWERGSQTTDSPGAYGKQGVAASGNMPGARSDAITWVDSSGNLWLFGGSGFDSTGTQDQLNDLWEFNPISRKWTWVSGSDTVDAPSVYGTQGVAAPGNVPGARHSAMTWTDQSGNLWMFGGVACCVLIGSIDEYYDINELWMFSPSTGMWTWEGGSQSPNASGVYGTQGVAAAGNIPSARDSALTWVDENGQLWLFGGEAFTYSSGASGGESFNDLWKFDPVSRQWTWVNGPDTPNGGGDWGTVGVAAASNIPSARTWSAGWLGKTGNLWLMGGYGLDASENLDVLNDLWKYNVSTGKWTWLGGTITYTAGGVYGTQSVPAAANTPGGRYAAVYWSDKSGDGWIFGGYGASGISYSSSNKQTYTIKCCLNDMWKFHP